MAAISALMVSETPLRREPLEEDRNPTTPRTASRMMSPAGQGNDATMHSVSDSPERPELRTTQSSATSTESVLKLTTANLEKATQEDLSPDAMDLDQDKDDQDRDEDGSDNDTEQGDPNGVSRKKKGQRFFCTGYPPCNLSFTRSEHLARHIRKHTGERPFQCHCNRRFSRLDNLRQHAQTVHVNEEIPTDSLAATGTRFQRQIRTDRVRPAGRPRSGTMSSTGTHSRGHSRNLSTSSIGSTSSNYSTSTIDPRRRPPPLLMAGDGRPKLGIDPPSTPPQQYTAYATYSPGDVQTPTSATFSTTPGSPAFGSTIGSPLANTSRGGFYQGTRTPSRRLSVPSAPNMFSSPFPPPFSAFPSQAPGTALSSNNSTITSPTSSTFSHSTNPNSIMGDDWRRRTWHPSTYSGLNLNYSRPATSGLTYSQTPDAPQPAFAQNAIAAAGQAPRLPGIESFDHVQQRPTTPPRHNTSSFSTEPQRPPTLMPPADLHAHSHALGHRRHVSADVLRYSGPPLGHDRSTTERAPVTSTWMHDTMSQLRQIGTGPVNQGSEALRSAMAPPPVTATHAQQDIRQSMNVPGTGRGGVYHSAAYAARVSPEDSGSSEGVPTPGASVAEVNPTIMPMSGILDTQHSGLHLEGTQQPCFPAPPILHSIPGATSTHNQSSTQEHSRTGGNHQLNRLDALAAVATSGGDGQEHGR